MVISSSPGLIDVSIAGARGVLVNITGGSDLALHDVHEATSIISEAAGDEANIIFGAVIDPRLDDEIRVTVIATGFGTGSKTPRPKTQAETISLTMPRIRVKGSPMDLFGADGISSIGANRFSGLSMGDSDVLSQPSQRDDDSDNLDVPAFVRKQMVHSSVDDELTE